MTWWTNSYVFAQSVLLGQEAAEPVIERLDPARRAAVMMAIFGLVLLGLALVACVMIGGRWLRNHARHRLGPSKLPPRKRRPVDTGAPPKGPADAGLDETVDYHATSKETRVD